MYTLKSYPRGPNFGPFPSTISGFQDISHILQFPIDSHVKHPRKKRTKEIAKNPKFKISQFFIQLWLPLTRSMHDFLGANLFCVFRQDVFEVFSPIWSHVNENEKKWQKSKIRNFANHYTTLVETVSRGMHELGMNLLCTFRDVVWIFFLPYSPMLTKTRKNS